MAVNLNAGTITFRHSVRKTPDGKYGYPVSARVKKLSLTEQAGVVSDLERLQTEQPSKRPDWCGPKAWEIWGKDLPPPLPPLNPILKNIKDAALENAIDDSKEEGRKDDAQYFELALKLQQTERYYKDEIKNREKRIRDLEALLESYAVAAGISSEDEKNFTLDDALNWGLGFMKFKSEERARKVLAKCCVLTELLGLETKLVDLNSRKIVDAIEDQQDLWEYNTRLEYKQAAKTWLSQVRKEFKFKHDTVGDIVVGTPQASEDGETKSPVDAIKELDSLIKAKSDKLNGVNVDRLRLVVAVAGFSGMRLKETLQTNWEGIKLPVIEVVKQAQKGTGKSKKRYAYCFNNLTTYLPKEHPEAGPLFEKGRSDNLCHDAEQVYGSSIFNALRRWHSTEMGKDPALANIEAIANGHSKKISAKHYQDMRALIESAGNRKVK